MKRVYHGKNLADAHIFKDLLENNGIAADVQGEYLAGVWGSMGLEFSRFPSVWVLRDDDEGKALKLIENFRNRQ